MRRRLWSERVRASLPGCIDVLFIVGLIALAVWATFALVPG